MTNLPHADLKTSYMSFTTYTQLVRRRGVTGEWRQWIGMQGERVSRSRGSGKLGSGLWGKDEVEAGGVRKGG